MSAYVDSSALLKRYVEEADSAAHSLVVVDVGGRGDANRGVDAAALLRSASAPTAAWASPSAVAAPSDASSSDG